ncbi:MAG: sulfotransferase [Candidatus Omnitrophica bacterium]|nr:sulfotransferase [Candidatus Omnitrophota bacterium]
MADRRLIQRPVFIVAYAYGGSNILLNLMRSHPDLCSPRGELNEVFKGKLEEPYTTRIAKCLRYLPCVIAEGGRDIFRFNDWTPREPFKPFTQRRVDRILFDEKRRARERSQNYFKAEDILYTDKEVREARLVCKGLDGLTFVTPELSRMYPDAAFIALVRNGFAVVEGHLRRGHRLEKIAAHYELGCKLMQEHARTIPRYNIIRYEEIIASPLESLKKLYQWADVDIHKIKKVRLQAKPVIGKTGAHEAVQGEKRPMFWYPLEEMSRHFRPDANENQIKRLSEEQKETIRRLCPTSLKEFGYL